MEKEIIVLGGGCFWCTEAVFDMLKGIESVEPGYAGGTVKNPTYEQVCGGETGHVEVIRVTYYSDVVSLENILTVFFGSHDPTQANGQGNDIGTQYRSVIFYTKESQKMITQKFIDGINTSSETGAPITTTVEPLTEFYPAEEYHKNYYANNKNQSYCRVIINPKLKKVQEHFAQLLK